MDSKSIDKAEKKYQKLKRKTIALAKKWIEKLQFHYQIMRMDLNDNELTLLET